MAKKYDITIFGATGLTGKYIVEQVYELATQQPDAFPSDFSWAIAGRVEGKVREIQYEFNTKYPHAAIQQPTVLVANIVRREQLDQMTCHSTVLINAVGPFRFMGEYVVRSCVEQQCHYVDVTGEPEFVERMQRTYHKQAVDKKVTIVHSCGFDSVPTDMGVLWIKQLYASQGWTPTQIEMFFKLHTGPAGLRGGYATYESAVHGFGSVELLREIRKASELAALPRPAGPKLTFHKRLTRDKQLGYHVPFVFADPSIVRLSQQLFLTGYATPQHYNNKSASMPPTVQFAAYCLLPSLWIGFLYYLYGFVFSFLAASPWGRQLLLRYPEQFSAGVFSRDHPTSEQLQQTSFEITLRSKGYQSLTMAGIDAKTTPLNAEMTAVVSGPEPGYVATPRIALQCALNLLQNHKSGSVPLGVLTPSAAFWNTDLIDRLATVGIVFEHVC